MLAFYASKFDFSIISVSNYFYEASLGGTELYISSVFNKGFLWTFLVMALNNNRILRVYHTQHTCNPYNSFWVVMTLCYYLQFTVEETKAQKIEGIVQDHPSRNLISIQTLEVMKLFFCCLRIHPLGTGRRFSFQLFTSVMCFSEAASPPGRELWFKALLFWDGHLFLDIALSPSRSPKLQHLGLNSCSDCLGKGTSSYNTNIVWFCSPLLTLCCSSSFSLLSLSVSSLLPVGFSFLLPASPTFFCKCNGSLFIHQLLEVKMSLWSPTSQASLFRLKNKTHLNVIIRQTSKLGLGQGHYVYICFSNITIIHWVTVHAFIGVQWWGNYGPKYNVDTNNVSLYMIELTK